GVCCYAALPVPPAHRAAFATPVPSRTSTRCRHTRSSQCGNKATTEIKPLLPRRTTKSPDCCCHIAFSLHAVFEEESRPCLASTGEDAKNAACRGGGRKKVHADYVGVSLGA